MSSIESFIADLTHSPLPACMVSAHRILPPEPPQGHPLPDRFPPWLQDMLRTQGLTQLTQGQRLALDALDQGQHVFFTAPAGRRLVRLLMLFQSPEPTPPGHSLHIFPHRPHSRVQRQSLTAWNDLLAPDHQCSAAAYDGDTPVTERRRIRQTPPRLILTTPDMLHAGILAYHSGWRAFLQDLRHIVLADVHLCTGALATHLCHLLRRLYRLALHYGSRPQFLLTSAPLAGADDLAQTLTGYPCQVVTGGTWRRHLQHRLIIQTQSDLASAVQHLQSRLGEARLPALILETQDQFEASVKTDATQPAAPLAIPAQTASDFYAAEHRILQGQTTQISLPHDAHPGVIRPSVIQVLVCSGIPVSLAHLHAWLARLDTSATPSLSLLIVDGRSALDHYLLHHPNVYQEDWPQLLPIDLHSVPVLQQHIRCAAAEAALRSDGRYPGVPRFTDQLQQLAARGLLTRRSASQRWIATENRPHRRLNLRWFERPYVLIDVQKGRRLGRLSAPKAFRECFEGAQYPRPGEGVFHVERYDRERCRINVHPAPDESQTRARRRTDVHERRLVSACMHDAHRLTYGRLVYTEVLQAFERLAPATRERQSVHMVTGHQRDIDTHATWLTLPVSEADAYRKTALHTAVHALLAALPLVCLSDQGDVRAGVYTALSEEQSHLEAIFVDAHAGGNGTGLALFQHHTAWLGTALTLLQQCDCTHGCSRCTASYCDTCQEHGPLDRAAAIDLLQRLLGTIVAPDTPRPDGRPRHLYLCLTTQKTADDVGGWQHKHLLGLGLAMTYDTHDGCYRVYTEESVASLIAALQRADLVIGFNTRDFDYQILQFYTEHALPTLPTCAILDDIQQALGYRVSFRQVLQETLGVGRPDDSLATVGWYREGHTEQLINLCRRDIDFTRDLVHYGVTNGTLWHRDRLGQRSAVPVNWPFIS